MKLKRWGFAARAVIISALSIIITGASGVGTPTFAQTTAQESIAKAESLLVKNDLKVAKKFYKAALKKDKNNVAAYIGLGKVEMARDKWPGAGEYFGRALKRDPDNFEAHYYRAICYRESGKSKALLFRKIDWDKSKKYFQWIIDRSKNYRDVLYQFALLKQYRRKYPEAIALAQEQIQLRPDLADARAGLYRIYRSYIRNKKASEVEAWLLQQPWPQARFALGELWRRNGRLHQADSLFQALLLKKPAMRPQPIFLALARIHYAQNQPEIGQRYFWLAVDTMEEPGDATLVFEDLKYIISDDELKAYRTLKSISEKKAFFHAFWARRDPTPAALVNVRLQEHYRRLMYAEKYYEYDGFRTWFNSPDKLGYLNFPPAYKLNYEFNDKGLIYI
ncbi:MAG: GWxTD domain-containing protein, partial [Calditrichaeota bacterium]